MPSIYDDWLQSRFAMGQVRMLRWSLDRPPAALASFPGQAVFLLAGRRSVDRVLKDGVDAEFLLKTFLRPVASVRRRSETQTLLVAIRHRNVALLSSPWGRLLKRRKAVFPMKLPDRVGRFPLHLAVLGKGGNRFAIDQLRGFFVVGAKKPNASVVSQRTG